MAHAEGDLTQTVANHYNQLEEKGLEERKKSRIFYLRNFNNWVKSVLIGETLKKLREESKHKPVTVLDLCCGKGGDLLKWKKGRIDHLVCAVLEVAWWGEAKKQVDMCVHSKLTTKNYIPIQTAAKSIVMGDIAATSVEQCESRYRDSRHRGRGRFQEKEFTAEFLVADCTKVRLKNMYKDPGMKFDLASCQFSFHYCFESFPQAVTMLQNACECLRVGGYFIGSTPNAFEIIRRLRQSSDNSFGNEVYRVTFENNDKRNFPLFGAKYSFHLEGVVDCPEFLVYFPLLEKMAEQFGMQLVYKTRFDDLFQENSAKDEYRMLLNKMQALEPFPPEEGQELVGLKDTDYEHAKQTLKSQTDTTSQDRRLRNKIGTLSKAEWDAANLEADVMLRSIEKTQAAQPQAKNGAAGKQQD